MLMSYAQEVARDLDQLTVSAKTAAHLSARDRQVVPAASPLRPRQLRLMPPAPAPVSSDDNLDDLLNGAL